MKNWIKAPIKLDRNDFLCIDPVRVSQGEIPEDEQGNCLDEDAESVYGYFAISDDGGVPERELVNVFVEISDGVAYFPIGQHSEGDTAGVAADGRLYAISFEDFQDMLGAVGVPGAYRLDTLGREAEDPYRKFAD